MMHDDIESLPGRKLNQKDIEWLEHQNRRVWVSRAITGGMIVLGIVALSLPIMAARALIEALAGKETSVDVSIGLAIGGTALGAFLSNWIKNKKIRQQGDELIRLRTRCEEMEKRLPLPTEPLKRKKED